MPRGSPGRRTISHRRSVVGGEPGIGVHGWAFQPFGEEARRTVKEARDRGSGGHPFTSVLQACAALQCPLSGRSSVEGWHRVPTSRRATWWKAPRGDVLRYGGPCRLRAGRKIAAVPRWYK